MNCHMHQPNMFLNTYLRLHHVGLRVRRALHVAEGAEISDRRGDAQGPGPQSRRRRAARQLVGSSTSCAMSIDLNPKLKDTQFADYHGHGWNFRAIFKRDRDGNLLDADGKIVANDDPEKWRKNGEGKFAHRRQSRQGGALMDIHAEKGMQCADCHFAQDSHGSGLIMGEVANAVEIGCKDCHGTVSDYPTLRPRARPRRPAAPIWPVAQPGRPAPVRMGRARWPPPALSSARSLDPQLRMESHPGEGSVDPTSPDYQPEGRPRQADVAHHRRRQAVAVGPGVASQESRPQGQRDGVFRLPHLLDDVLRRLPPADRGELEDRQPQI